MEKERKMKRTRLVQTTIDQVNIGQPWRLQRHEQACEYVITGIEGKMAWVVNTKNGWQSVVDLSYKCKVYVETLV